MTSATDPCNPARIRVCLIHFVTKLLLAFWLYDVVLTRLKNKNGCFDTTRFLACPCCCFTRFVSPIAAGPAEPRLGVPPELASHQHLKAYAAACHVAVRVEIVVVYERSLAQNGSFERYRSDLEYPALPPGKRADVWFVHWRHEDGCYEVS